MAFLFGTATAFVILPVGLGSPWGDLWRCSVVRSPPGLALSWRTFQGVVLALSLASLVLAGPVGAVLLFVVKINLVITTVAVFAIVAAVTGSRSLRVPGDRETRQAPNSG